MKNIICCIHLSWEYVPKLFMYSCFDMLRHSVDKYNLVFLNCGGCYLDKARDELAKKALSYNPDYILWLDADQTYPANTPEVLMKHVDDGKLVVGGVTPLKRLSDENIDGKPSVWNLDTETRMAYLREIFLNQGLIKIEAMGLGGVMMNPEVFKKVEFPWFQQMWNVEKKYCMSVDLQFFENCKKAGVEVWCDTNLIYGHVVVRPMKLKARTGMVEL